MGEHDADNVTGVFLSPSRGKAMSGAGAEKIITLLRRCVRATPERLCYSVSKAAVVQMTRALAVDGLLWRDRELHCPGSLDLYPGRADPEYLKLNDERAQRIPLRLWQLDDVGPPCVLCLRASISHWLDFLRR